MKLLNAPYGWASGNFVHITLIPFRDIDIEDVAIILYKYGCYIPSVNNILSCLVHSQYSCNLQAGWFNNRYMDVYTEFHDAGIKLVVNKVVKNNKNQEDSKLFMLNELEA